MAELSLKERLQPALLDRLLDDARYVTRYRLTLPRAELGRLQLMPKDLLSILAAQGLKPEQDDASHDDPNGETLVLELVATRSAVSPAQLKALTIRPPGAPLGVTMQSFCQIESSAALNMQPESADKRNISMRRLREIVQRDLGWLLNSASLDTTEDLKPYPEVARSVLNFGMPSFAGTALHSIDPQATAQRIRQVIETFEPRLGKVQVIPEIDGDKPDAMTLSFRIEGELWGQPVSQHVVLQTRIDVETGDVRIGDAGNR
jgi:type VI secretion system protein ImpF